VDNSNNGGHSADGWKALFAQCARRLRRRALAENDPVRIYTSKPLYDSLTRPLFVGRILSRQKGHVRVATRLL
jgi:hypothetical protein